MDREYKQVRVSDLPDLTRNRIFPEPFLTCPCGIELSGNRGDYFMAKKDVVLHCDECGEDMVLMTKRVVYEEWSPKREPKNQSEELCVGVDNVI